MSLARFGHRQHYRPKLGREREREKMLGHAPKHQLTPKIIRLKNSRIRNRACRPFLSAGLLLCGGQARCGGRSKRHARLFFIFIMAAVDSKLKPFSPVKLAVKLGHFRHPVDKNAYYKPGGSTHTHIRTPATSSERLKQPKVIRP